MKLNWTDSQRIGEALYDLDGETHPLKIRFTDLHKRVLALPGFTGAAEDSSEGILEAIQMVWYEEWQEDHDPSDDPYSTGRTS
jgi:FeS assembly protein IscX